MRTNTTLGQKVKNARMPRPIGFGLGSRVTPRLAKAMTVNKGPLPSTSKISPAQKTLETRNLTRCVCPIIAGGLGSK